MGGKSGCMLFCINDRLGMRRFYQGISTPQCIWCYWMMKGNCLLNMDFIWIQDYASAHQVKGLTKKLNDPGWEMLDWTPYSPDLNPIENLWVILNNRLCGESCCVL